VANLRFPKGCGSLRLGFLPVCVAFTAFCEVVLGALGVAVEVPAVAAAAVAGR